MSLVGSLEDLSLGDILQIITLSRKSGALSLRSETGEGRIVFRDGLVCGAHRKGHSPDLRGLVVGSGALDDAAFDAAREEAREAGTRLDAVLSERLTPERYDTLRRESIERAVLDMFGWNTGEFSFEVGDGTPEDEFEIVLERGVNAQYLAMEGTRRTDEGAREPEVDPDDVASFADVAEEIESEAEPVVLAEAEAPSDAFEAVALTTAERVGSGMEPASRTDAAVDEAFLTAVVEREDVAEPVASPVASGPRPPVVVLDPHLGILEWVKSALEDSFPRVHIFPKAELGVERIRQYLVKGDLPLVLVSPEVPVDPASGVADPGALVEGLKRRTPRLRVLWLVGETEDPPGGAADGALVKPELHELAGERLREAREARAAELRAGALAGGSAAAPAHGAGRAGARARLKQVSARLSDPATRGEVLNVVLEYAAEDFARVALFMVRDGTAHGLAQRGLDRAGGPDDAGLRQVCLAVDDSPWLRSACESREPSRSAREPEEPLAARLGSRPAAEAYVAPLVSGDQVVAVLYADNLPGGEPLGDASHLEIALHQAGLALDRAVLERALAAANPPG